ncbi:MAG: hypothetical protein AABX33_00825 [Nanoarchaeota archaeon]
MALKRPSSMDECVYFTNRSIGSGKAVAWVFRKECPKCKKDFMNKPRKKSGAIDKKAEHYVCESCSYQESNEQIENSLVLNVEYRCPYCSDEGETTSEFKRKTFEGVPSFVFECQKCHKLIGLTKKMKEKKRKKEDSED